MYSIVAYAFFFLDVATKGLEETASDVANALVNNNSDASKSITIGDIILFLTMAMTFVFILNPDDQQDSSPLPGLILLVATPSKIHEQKCIYKNAYKKEFNSNQSPTGERTLCSQSEMCAMPERRLQMSQKRPQPLSFLMSATGKSLQ